VRTTTTSTEASPRCGCVNIDKAGRMTLISPHAGERWLTHAQPSKLVASSPKMRDVRDIP
jgi:hypothetical protein